ncbi:MAG: VOC family protein [Planctomycetales bacterium]|nr:VOC family protein [Planctomycetales bacterium]
MHVQGLNPGPLNHFGLASVDLDRATRFYCDTLGFRVVRRPSFSFEGRWLYRAEVGPMIHLIYDAGHQPPGGEINTRGNHFAMRCEDYDLTISLLKNLGVEFVERVLPDYGYRQVFFRDPDGHVVELGEWPDVHDMDLSSSD